MKTIRQHIPNFIDGCNPEGNTFETIDELLSKKWIKSWGQDKFEGIPFWRYSEAPHGNENLLMIVSHANISLVFSLRIANKPLN